jgi:hypothetical protein
VTVRQIGKKDLEKGELYLPRPVKFRALRLEEQCDVVTPDGEVFTVDAGDWVFESADGGLSAAPDETFRRGARPAGEARRTCGRHLSSECIEELAGIFETACASGRPDLAERLRVAAQTFRVVMRVLELVWMLKEEELDSSAAWNCVAAIRAELSVLEGRLPRPTMTVEEALQETLRRG